MAKKPEAATEAEAKFYDEGGKGRKKEPCPKCGKYVPSRWAAGEAKRCPNPKCDYTWPKSETGGSKAKGKKKAETTLAPPTPVEALEAIRPQLEILKKIGIAKLNSAFANLRKAEKAIEEQKESIANWEGMKELGGLEGARAALKLATDVQELLK